MSRPDDGDGGFLGRWARRKHDAQRTAAAPPSPDAPATTPAAAAEADLPLPSLDSVVSGADVSAFFQAHVPDALRQAALRKLWTTDPEIRGFIEMADYQWDFNNPDAIPGWSSTIEGSKVTELAKRILGELVKGDDDAKTARAVAGGTVPPPEIHEERENPPMAPAQAEQPQAISDAAAPSNVAAQKIQEETVVYAPSRKRHGGALPT